MSTSVVRESPAYRGFVFLARFVGTGSRTDRVPNRVPERVRSGPHEGRRTVRTRRPARGSKGSGMACAVPPARRSPGPQDVRPGVDAARPAGGRHVHEAHRGDLATRRPRRGAARHAARADEYRREGFARLDRGEIDPFELDDLIHHYKRAAQNYGASAARRAQVGNALRALWHSCVRTANRTTGALRVTIGGGSWS